VTNSKGRRHFNQRAFVSLPLRAINSRIRDASRRRFFLPKKPPIFDFYLTTMTELRAKIIERVDALVDRDVSAFMHELCCLDDLGGKDEGLVEMSTGNGLGGPNPHVWAFRESVFVELLRLFGEGRYSVKVVESEIGLMVALTTCPKRLDMPVISKRSDFASKKQHWMIMTLHKGTVPGCGHWFPRSDTVMGFHWAPNAECSVCANVPGK